MMIEEMINEYAYGNSGLSPENLAAKVRGYLSELADNLSEQKIWPESEKKPVDLDSLFNENEAPGHTNNKQVNPEPVDKGSLDANNPSSPEIIEDNDPFK